MSTPELFGYVKQRKTGVDDRFYVYIHRRKTDNKIYYVGKGSGSRAWNFSNRNKFWHNVHNKHGTLVEIVFDNLSEDESLQVEIDTILEFKYFGFNLVNQSSGGESPKFSAESKKKMSESRRGKPLSQKHKESLSKSQTGRPRPDLVDKNTDKNSYYFIRLMNGEIFYGTRKEFCDKYNQNIQGLRTLFQTTRPYRSYHGWGLLKE